MKNYGTNG
jgi:hypothetical protein